MRWASLLPSAPFLADKVAPLPAASASSVDCDNLEMAVEQGTPGRRHVPSYVKPIQAGFAKRLVLTYQRGAGRMPLVTQNQRTARETAARTDVPAMSLALRETPGRRINRTWPTISTTQTMPMTPNVTSQKMLGGSGTNDGSSGNCARSHRSSQTFSTAMRNTTAVSSQVRLRVSDFR